MRKLTAALNKELHYISHRLYQVDGLPRSSYHGKLIQLETELHEYQMRMEEMMEKTDCKDG